MRFIALLATLSDRAIKRQTLYSRVPVPRLSTVTIVRKPTETTRPVCVPSVSAASTQRKTNANGGAKSVSRCTPRHGGLSANKFGK
jgi:hypothetical protein